MLCFLGAYTSPDQGGGMRDCDAQRLGQYLPLLEAPWFKFEYETTGTIS